MSKAALLRWVADRDAAALRERDLARANLPAPAEAFARALALAAFVRKLHGWPPRETDAEIREDMAGYACWDALRVRWPAR